MKKCLTLFTLAAAWLVLSGCAVLEGQDISNDPSSDAGIASIANSRLNNDSLTGPATLNATVQDGQAILYGTVPDEATRQRALQILAATPGILDTLDRTRKR